MSQYPTFLNEKLADYLLENFSSEDSFLRRLREESQRLGYPQICISGEQGAFLQFLLTVMEARYVLEIGSLAGYSAITMAKALPKDGKLVCLEKNEEYASFIRTKAEEGDYEKIIEVITGGARVILESYKPTFKFDFVFIDADKESYLDYLNLCLPLVRKGGVIAADNALAFGFVADDTPLEDVDEVLAIQEFNKAFKNDFRFITAIAPVGDGLIMGVKLI